jgi:hypothetical protein
MILSSCSRTSSQHVSFHYRDTVHEIHFIGHTVPLATLVQATKPPTNEPAILTPQGFKRYFVVHGGLFSTDNVTLDDIRKIQRTGRQPGQEGLMCE